LHVGTSVAQALTTGFASRLLFVISVVFMVRMYALQMSAEPLSARVRRRFLTDAVQRHAMGALEKCGAPDLDGFEPFGYGVRRIRPAESHCPISCPASPRNS
jgi:hypothetical protein